MKPHRSFRAVRSLRAGVIEMDLDHRTVLLKGSAVELSTKEFDLLRALVETKGAVVSRQFILEKIWGHASLSDIESHTVDVYIHRLRQKLGSEGCHILTVPNVGYRFDISLDWVKFGA